MTHRHDGSIDRSRAGPGPPHGRARTAGALLERIAKLGAAPPRWPRSSPPARAARASAAASAAAAPPRARHRQSAPPPASTADPRTDARPDPRGRAVRLQLGRVHGQDVDPRRSRRSTGIKVTYDFFDNYDTMFAKIGQDGGGYDVTFPTSIDIPGIAAARPDQALDPSFLTNIGNLGAEWANPGYDPGNAHSVPYMWWTTGIALRHRRRSRRADQLERAVGREVCEAHRGPRRHAGGVRRRPVPAGQGPQHDQ